ncbi:Bud site selection protein 6 [Tulasnella sp. 419]|nr:Bud site selection protein 6 [Tulasnella sp. 418]KAG8963736.1 Bud site selection protein 6 [Tulasnella sp. 419]
MQVESQVTALLVSIKRLLDSLTEWGNGSATSQEVSQKVSQLQNRFSTCINAFTASEITVQDLLGIPEQLEAVMGQLLAFDPSQTQLDAFMPQIRAIIIELLQGLRGKQSLYRQRANVRRRR